MKKEANVILAKCKKDQLYGIRIEKRENDWVRTWAFRLQEEMAEKEERVIFGGRLGEYKYYDMDQVIAAALEKASQYK